MKWNFVSTLQSPVRIQVEHFEPCTLLPEGTGEVTGGDEKTALVDMEGNGFRWKGMLPASTSPILITADGVNVDGQTFPSTLSAASNRSSWLLFFVIILLVIAVVGGVFVYRSRRATNISSPSSPFGRKRHR